MFDLRDYARRLEEIRKRELMTIACLCKELDMARNTLMRVMDPNNKFPIAFKTLKKIRDFVDAREKVI